jgi:hypothetical protein
MIFVPSPLMVIFFWVIALLIDRELGVIPDILIGLV